MNKEQFTPGPYTIEETKIFKGVAVVYGRAVICTINRELAAYEHNANLIAAAPDMYEALRHLVGICENDELMFPDFPPLKAAKFALNKANPQ
jgi:hypothetical protein